MSPNERFMRHHYGPSGLSDEQKKQDDIGCPACGNIEIPRPDIQRLQRALDDWAYQYPDRHLLAEYGDLFKAGRENCPQCGSDAERKPGEHWVLLDGGKRICTNPWHSPKRGQVAPT